jgi:uncharacterized protein (TIGR01319 family)
MSVYLLVDFGSTYTKILAVDLSKEVILGRAQAPTTIDTDVTIGLNNALTELVDSCGLDLRQVEGKYASSSAAGGLKMAAIGLVPAERVWAPAPKSSARTVSKSTRMSSRRLKRLAATSSFCAGGLTVATRG